jgi:tetratricopeptide (TPR) repeat protein
VTLTTVTPVFAEHALENSPVRSDEPKFRPLSPAEHVQAALGMLRVGDEISAKTQLNEALALDPANRTARSLMRQINTAPESYFSQDSSFEYVVGPGDTITTVADRFLKNPLEFHILAKYNGLTNPASLVPGSVLRIPGNKPKSLQAKNIAAIDTSPTPDTSQADVEKPVVRLKTKAELVAEKAKEHHDAGAYDAAIDLLRPLTSEDSVDAVIAEMLAMNYRDYANVMVQKDDLLEAQTLLEEGVSLLPDNASLRTQLNEVKKMRRAEHLYRLGMNAYSLGQETKAFEQFNDALRLNPNHKLARKQLGKIKPSVIENYHKLAMQHYRKQELQQAIRLWDDVLAIDPDHELAQMYRTKAQDLKRRIEQF